MDAAQALADLTEISSQVAQVAIFEGDGTLLATTASDPPLMRRLVTGFGLLVDEADRLGQARGLGGPVTQLEASTLEGSVFVVRSGVRLIAATTRADPTVGLVLYDLKRCLESLDEAAAPVAAANGSATGAARLERRSGADSAA